MPRPRICRRIFFQPRARMFSPAGLRGRLISDVGENILAYDESEAVRLVDIEEMEQSKAAKKMKISQPTLSRLLKSARKKLADSIINCKSIKIQGGVYEMAVSRGRGLGRGAGLGRRIGRGRVAGGGRGFGGGPLAAGPGGKCVCPKCGAEISHQIGVPCYQEKCPKCGAKMTRG